MSVPVGVTSSVVSHGEHEANARHAFERRRYARLMPVNACRIPKEIDVSACLGTLWSLLPTRVNPKPLGRSDVLRVTRTNVDALAVVSRQPFVG